MTLSEKLVILRKKAGMTQGELAAALEVSRQSVHKWESGRCFPEVPKLIAMKAIFGVSIDDMLDDSVEIEMPEKKQKRVKSEVEVKTAAPVLNSEPKVDVRASEKVKEDIPAAEPIVENIKLEVIDNKTEPEAKEEKKKGFFSKLFGRK